MKTALFIARVTRPTSPQLGKYFTGFARFADTPETAARRPIEEWIEWMREMDEQLECELTAAGLEENVIGRFSEGVQLEPAP